MTQLQGFSDRYHAGEYTAVWQELIALGEGVREEPFLSDATAVCKEIVRRAQINLRILHRRLLDLGYEFAEPEVALREAPEDGPRKIDEFEKEFGTVPLVARIWYSTFGSVNFCQADRQRAYLKGGPPPHGPDIYGLGSLPCFVFKAWNGAESSSRQ